MSGFIFNSNQIPMMLVPRAVADRFLSAATGSQLKVLLCLIRFEDLALTPEDIAKHCGIETDEVYAAVDFWQKNGLICRRGATLMLSGAALSQPQTLPRYNSDSILELKENDSSFAFLLEETERLLGKSLNHNDASVLYAMYDNLGFSSELALQLINFCKRSGKTNFRYIEKIAVDWYERGIDSFEKAEHLINLLEKRARTETAVAAYFGIEGRSLSKKEKEYIESWSSVMGMSLPMIKEAYERCIDSKGKLSFAYINGILSDWLKKGWKKPGDIVNDKKPAVSKSYNSGDIEKELYKRLAGGK